jgi:hypothetical protein
MTGLWSVRVGASGRRYQGEGHGVAPGLSNKEVSRLAVASGVTPDDGLTQLERGEDNCWVKNPEKFFLSTLLRMVCTWRDL